MVAGITPGLSAGRIRMAVCAALVIMTSAAAGCGSVTAGTRAASIRPQLTPTATVKYCGTALSTDVVDIYVSSAAPPPRPTLVFIHGGGWTKGNQKLGNDGYSIQVATQLLAAGWDVASIQYRLAQRTYPTTNPFPDQIIDTKCAIRFLKEMAQRKAYGIDPSRIAVMGSSAGGHLASLAGVAGPSAGWDCPPSTENCDQTSTVQAVVDEWGVADFTTPGWSDDPSQVIESVFGEAPGTDSPALEQASPVSYASANAPPFLVIQGDVDSTNLPDQAFEMGQRLTQAGDSDVTQIAVHRAPHGSLQPNEQPGPGQLTAEIVTWLEARLGT